MRTRLLRKAARSTEQVRAGLVSKQPMWLQSLLSHLLISENFIVPDERVRSAEPGFYVRAARVCKSISALQQAF